MTSTFSVNLDLEEPGTGDYPGAWGPVVNQNWAILDNALGAFNSLTFSNANITLTVPQAAFFMIQCGGTLTANVQLILPGGIGGRRVIFNLCTGPYTLTVLNGAGDTGGGVVCGQGYQTPVVLTSGRAYYDCYASTPPGTMLPYAGPVPPPGFLLCYGQSVPIATYLALWQAIGTTWGPSSGGNFTLPDYRGRAIVGADNMGGSAANRLTGYAVGSVGGEQTHTLTTTEMPVHTHAVNDTGHSHPVTDIGHDHLIHTNSLSLASGTNVVNVVGGPIDNQGTDTAFTGISIIPNTTGISNQTAGSGGAHNNVQPTGAANVMIRY